MLIAVGAGTAALEILEEVPNLFHIGPYPIALNLSAGRSG